MFCVVKRRPKLKSRYRERIEKSIKYAKTIKDFDDLVDPRTLAFYCLGPEPSAFVLQKLEKDKQLLLTREKLKVIATKVVEGFQQTEEYSTMLFSWYFKGFELLRWYMIKHPTRIDLKNLDMEMVDQEMAVDEAAQSTTPEVTPRDTSMPPPDGDDTAANV